MIVTILTILSLWALAFLAFVALWALLHRTRIRPIPHDDPRWDDELADLAVAPKPERPEAIR